MIKHIKTKDWYLYYLQHHDESLGTKEERELDFLNSYAKLDNYLSTIAIPEVLKSLYIQLPKLGEVDKIIEESINNPEMYYSNEDELIALSGRYQKSRECRNFSYEVILDSFYVKLVKITSTTVTESSITRLIFTRDNITIYYNKKERNFRLKYVIDLYEDDNDDDMLSHETEAVFDMAEMVNDSYLTINMFDGEIRKDEYTFTSILKNRTVQKIIRNPIANRLSYRELMILPYLDKQYKLTGYIDDELGPAFTALLHKIYINFEEDNSEDFKMLDVVGYSYKSSIKHEIFNELTRHLKSLGVVSAQLCEIDEDNLISHTNVKNIDELTNGYDVTRFTVSFECGTSGFILLRNRNSDDEGLVIYLGTTLNDILILKTSTGVVNIIEKSNNELLDVKYFAMIVDNYENTLFKISDEEHLCEKVQSIDEVTFITLLEIIFPNYHTSEMTAEQIDTFNKNYKTLTKFIYDDINDEDKVECKDNANGKFTFND